MFYFLLAETGTQARCSFKWHMLFVGFVSLMLLLPVANANNDVDVPIEELEMLQAQGAILIDIRTLAEIAKTGVIQGSDVLPFFNDQGYSDGIAWLAAFSEKASPEQTVVLIGQSSYFSLSVCNMLKYQEGYPNARLLKGGINAWLEQGKALTAWVSSAAEAEQSAPVITEDFSIIEQSIIVDD